ncbi:MAG TPA: dihydrofolate reductase family protein [Solirubrobacteraceae bacterium]|nr:dihydrofolate reductase family protein [Solirubrobacteraceae bacterium]
MGVLPAVRGPARGGHPGGVPRDGSWPRPRFDGLRRAEPPLRHGAPGRRTWEGGLPEGVTSPYPHLRQIVVSSTLTEPPDPALELIRDDVGARVRALKAEPGADIWLCGAAALAATLVDEIDELVLKVNPVVLGDAIGLFAGDVGPRTVEVTEHRAYPNGFALVRGRLRRG